LAGFEVISYGRFWVIIEVLDVRHTSLTAANVPWQRAVLFGCP
jgi:hypothetical protein